jgi:hypothetical protein
VKLFDANGTLLCAGKNPSGADITYISYFSGNSLLVTADSSRSLNIFDTKCNLVKSDIGKQDRKITGLVILNDRGVAITPSEDGKLLGVDLKNIKLLGSVSIVAAKDGVSALAASDDGVLGQEVRDARAAAATLGLQLLIFEAATEDAIEGAFAAVNRQQPAAMLVVTSPFYVTLAKEIAALAVRHGVPSIYGRREFVEAGGLMSYGYDVADGYRWLGNYAGRIRGDRMIGRVAALGWHFLLIPTGRRGTGSYPQQIAPRGLLADIRQSRDRSIP